MAMYAKGMSQRDIEDNLREIYGAEVSQALISKITDKILLPGQEEQNVELSISVYMSFSTIMPAKQLRHKTAYALMREGRRR